MTRRALRAPVAPGRPLGENPSTAGSADRAPAAAPTGAHIAPSAMLPVRSALAAQVKLARLADALAEVAGIVRELAQESLAVQPERALMGAVMPAPERPRLLRVQDLSELLRLDPRTVRRMRARGQLPPAIDLHSVLRWDEATVLAWINERREQ